MVSFYHSHSFATFLVVWYIFPLLVHLSEFAIEQPQEFVSFNPGSVLDTLAEKCQQALPAVMKYILPVDLIQYISKLGMDKSLDQVFSESFGHTCVSS